MRRMKGACAPLVLAGCTAVLCIGAAGTADAQYWLYGAGNAAPTAIQKSITVVSLAEQAIDTNHRTFGRWLLHAAQTGVDDAEASFPSAGFRARLDDARRYLGRGRNAKALRSLNGASGELRRLAAVWDVGGAEPKLAEVCALAEKGDAKGALAGVDALSRMVRIDPSERCMAAARAALDAALAKHAAGYELDSVRAAAEAKDALREGYLASRLTQSKILVAHARLMLEKGRRCRAKWTLRRAQRKLRQGGLMADRAKGEAITAMAADLDAACATLCAGGIEAPDKVAQVETKIAALLAIIRPAAK